jgi:diguanylate cyclase (GGDEF)-like protein/PAS domain S-box-containing protein
LKTAGAHEEEMRALVESLHRTGARLEELTAGEVDSVTDASGRTFLIGRAREQLRNADAAKQAAILNALPANIALLDAHGAIVSVNEAWKRFALANAMPAGGGGVGVDYLAACDAATGEGSADALHVAGGIRSVLAGVAPAYSREYACDSPSEPRSFRMTATPLTADPAGGVVIMHVDVTAERQASAALRGSERRFRDLLSNVALAAVILDREARITFCNEYLAGLTGWSREELIGEVWFDRFPQPAEGDLRPIFAALLRDRPDTRHREDPLVTRSGKLRLMRWSNSVLRAPSGEVIGTASIGEDITDQKRSLDALKQNEERRRQIVESSLDAIVAMDADGRLTEWNAQAERTFGWKRLQVLGLSLAETIIPARYREAHEKGLQRFMVTGKGPLVNRRVEIFAQHRDGHEFPVELAIAPVLLGQTWMFSAFIRDLGEGKRAERALLEMQRKSELILQAVGEGILGVDTGGLIVFENQAAARLLGYRLGDLAGLDAHAQMHHSRADGTPCPADECPILATTRDGMARHVEDEVFWRRDGSSFPVEYTTAPMYDERGALTGAVVAFRDVTERKDAEKRIQRLSRVHAMLSGINTLIVRVADRRELFEGACRIAVESGGFRMAWIGMVDPATQEGKVVAWHGGEAGFVETLRLTKRLGTADSDRPACRVLREGEPVLSNDIASDATLAPWLREDMMRRGIRALAGFPLLAGARCDGLLALLSDEPDVFDLEEARLLQELASDISFALDHIERKERLEYLAYYDVLTGLANRALFLQRVEHHRLAAEAAGNALALFVLDLERFKNINDSLGQAAGDALLVKVAEWLRQNAGDANLLARVGADQFAVLLPEAKREGIGPLIQGTLGKFLDHPFTLGESVLRVAAKVGVAVFPEDGETAETLFRNAEAALKKAKVAGDRYLFYDSGMTATVAGKLTLETQLRQALDRDEFVLHYQPKIALSGGAITGAEALIRWNDPRTGLVPPARFIPVLEEMGLIHDVGRWALRKALEDRRRWRAQGLAPVRIAVNVSPLQLRNAGFLEELRQALALDADAASGLELEITESRLMADVKHSIESLGAVRAMGVTLAIDDFGTGFSSLSYLARLPVHTLKIDRSFIGDMTGGPEGLALVSTIINLAHSLKLKVVAEGVETEEQSRLLRLLDCDELQGYVLSQPLASADFEARFLAANAPGTGTAREVRGL